MTRLTRADVTAERINGGWAASAIVGGYLRRIRYYDGWTKAQAVRAFLAEVNA